MLTLPNLLSILRLPLAFLFLQDSIFFRSLAIFLAMISDGLDGYIARRFRLSSRLGTVLDPLTDKFFVIFILTIFFAEERISLWEAAAFLCRDFSVLIFGIYLTLKGHLLNYRFRAIWCGKLTTTLQFFVLLGLTFKMVIPPFIYTTFMVLGLLALIELYLPKLSLEKPN